MKKHIALLLVCTLPFLSTHAAVNSPPAGKKAAVPMVKISDRANSGEIEISGKREFKPTPQSCTRSVKIYIPTQSGLIGIGLSITAPTCSEADAGIREAAEGFMKEAMK